MYILLKNLWTLYDLRQNAYVQILWNKTFWPKTVSFRKMRTLGVIFYNGLLIYCTLHINTIQQYLVTNFYQATILCFRQDSHEGWHHQSLLRSQSWSFLKPACYTNNGKEDLIPRRYKLKSLKRQCHEIFNTFFVNQNTTRAPYEQAKTVSRNFSFSRRYSRKTRVPIVVDYVDTMSAPRCWRGRWLCWHRVCVVLDKADRVGIDYTDTVSA